MSKSYDEEVRVRGSPAGSVYVIYVKKTKRGSVGPFVTLRVCFITGIHIRCIYDAYTLTMMLHAYQVISYPFQ